MKKTFLVAFIAIICVIGGLGIAIGGMYLFGGFNEKVVYADELHFNKTEVVSAENIFLQLDTTTEGVTRNTVKLVASRGGERVINFPETVKIGQKFRVIPRQDENGVNVGGNVTLTAYYDNNDANVSVQAKCELLIDIPIKTASVNLSTKKLRPEQQISICKKGESVTESLNIEPLFSLNPYKRSGVLNSTIKETLIDKVLYIELASLNDNMPINQVAYFVDETGKRYTDSLVQIKYSYDSKGNLIFDNTINLKAGNLSSDAKINMYAYSTYKDQTNNISGTTIHLNKEDAINNVTNFLVGSYVIDNMTIFNKDDVVVNQNVLLNQEVKIYLNNPDARKDEINLNLQLEASTSPNAYIGNLEYRNNVYLHVDNENFITLAKRDGTIYTEGDRGININCNGLGDQLSTWYWTLKINNFHAYYNYLQSNQTLTATLSYYSEEDGLVSVPVKTFNVVPTINEVAYLAPKYAEGESSFKVKSGETFNIGPKDIESPSATAATPTYTDLAFYLDFAENSKNGRTTISTVPTQAGDYKATFTFTLSQLLEQSQLNNMNLTCSPSWATIDMDKTVFARDLNYNGKDYRYTAEVYLTIHTTTTDDVLFNLADYNVSISTYIVKFYEKMEDSTSFQSIPYLSIGGIRYYIDFDFYADSENNKYLKINNEMNFGNAYTVSGIGSFIITAQLVYIEDEDIIYWLGKKTNVQVDVYEELSTLYASNYISDDEYNSNFVTTTFSEEDDETHYIFITSNEIEALKNYVAYGQIKVSYKQYFAGINTNNYVGIDEINKNAITFGDSFIPVIRNNVIVGYRLSYKINPVSTIKIDDKFIDNIFRVEIVIEVNGEKVYAEFKMDTSNNNFLDLKIEDRIITEAVLSYNSSGNTGNVPDRAIELRANVTNGVFSYGEGIENYLRYYFKYNEADTTGITTSLSYELRVLNNDLGINLANLYNFESNFDETIGMGRGGLKFYNFPVNMGEDGINKGVLVEFTIFSNDAKFDFNTHYEYVNGMFVKTLNDNLRASIYFRIYGVEISIEANNEIEFVGYKGNEVDVFGGKDNTNSIFNITVKSGTGTEIEVTDYSQLFTAVAGNAFASFKQTDDKITYSKFVVNKDCLNPDTISFSFYIGSPAEANRIKIKRGDDYVTTYYQTLSPAYSVEFLTDNLKSPSSDNQLVKVTYNNPEKPDDISGINIFVLLPDNLPTFEGISTPIMSVKDNRVSFITVPASYLATLKLVITKQYADGTAGNFEQSFTINVEPSFAQDDLIIGEIDEESKVRAITAGVDTFAVFGGELDKIKDNISSINVLFEDVEEDKKVPANLHMSSSFVGGKLMISSTSLNYDKSIKSTFTLTFKDGGMYIYVKTFKVLGNITLEFTDANKTLNIAQENNKPFLLTDVNNYIFTENGVVNAKENGFEIALLSLEHDNMNAEYNKNSFVFDNNIFEDKTLAGAERSYILRVRYENFEKDRQLKTIIKFKYIVGGNYTLVFDLEITINILGTANLTLQEDKNVLNIKNNNNSLNLIDESLYNFTVDGVEQNARFKEEILDAFDYKNEEATYNKNSFTYDSHLFEDITLVGVTGDNKLNKFILKVKFDDLEAGTYNTTIKFRYMGETKAIEFTFNITINITK